jgi:hypothetical protein
MIVLFSRIRPVQKYPGLNLVGGGRGGGAFVARRGGPFRGGSGRGGGDHGGGGQGGGGLRAENVQTTVSNPE